MNPHGIVANIDPAQGISAIPRELCSVHFPLAPGDRRGSPGFLIQPVAPSSRFQQSFTDQPSHQQRGAVHSNRLVDIAAMKVHGSKAEMEPSGDFFRRQSIGYQQSDFQLPLRELHAPVGRRMFRRWFSSHGRQRVLRRRISHAVFLPALRSLDLVSEGIRRDPRQLCR